MFSRVSEIMRLREAAKRDRTPGFREVLYLSPGREVVCESKSDLAWWEEFTKGLASGHLRPHEFSIRELFERTIKDGRELANCLDPRRGPDAGTRELIEAAGAITSGDFSSITGQLIYSRMMEDLTPEEFPFQALIPTQQTQFSGEKIPGIANLGDQAEVVAEGEAYPLVGTGEDYIETPATTKRGFIVPITKEAIFSDRTGMLLQKAGKVGESLRINKEKRAINCVIDENTTTHRYKWRGTTYATYVNTPWDNLGADAPLVDWTDIDEANQVLNGILDPNTGEPVVVEADTLICTKSKELAALRIRNATEITVVTVGFATTGNPTQTRLPNPMGGKFTVLSSRLLASRLADDNNWFYGNPRKAFVYMENWGITVTQSPAGNSDDFNNDIVSKFKCSERGQYATIEPRLMMRVPATS
jgi:hypothetical protein